MENKIAQAEKIIKSKMDVADTVAGKIMLNKIVDCMISFNEKTSEETNQSFRNFIRTHHMSKEWEEWIKTLEKE